MVRTVSEQLKLYEEDIEKICKKNKVKEEDTTQLILMVQHLCYQLHVAYTSGRAVETIFKNHTNKTLHEVFPEYLEEVQKEEEKFPFECKELMGEGEE